MIRRTKFKEKMVRTEKVHKYARTIFYLKRWYHAMEYLPNKYGISRGPFFSKKLALKMPGKKYESMIFIYGHQKVECYRWRNHKWEVIKSKKINI